MPTVKTKQKPAIYGRCQAGFGSVLTGTTRFNRREARRSVSWPHRQHVEAEQTQGWIAPARFFPENDQARNQHRPRPDRPWNPITITTDSPPPFQQLRCPAIRVARLGSVLIW